MNCSEFNSTNDRIAVYLLALFTRYSNDNEILLIFMYTEQIITVDFISSLSIEINLNAVITDALCRANGKLHKLNCYRASVNITVLIVASF